jgi:hypothetical protein
MRTKKVADQLFITDHAHLSAEMRKQIKDISKDIHEFDIQGVDIQAGIDGLNEIQANLNAIDTDSTGVDSARLENVTTRVTRRVTKFDELKQALITAKRKVALANKSSTVPAQDLQDAHDSLQTAISISQELGREISQFRSLQEKIEEFLEEIPDTKTAPVSEPDLDAPTDENSGIQANEISEYYEALWNLKRLTTAIQGVVDDVDKPMEQWCSFVEAFFAGDIDDHPSYGELQAEFNEFSISTYRDVYGDGDRITKFHVIDVEPLTATVQQLLENSSQQPTTSLELPVAPDSGTRLPIIVETEAELDRAIALLRELPKSPSRAVSPAKITGPDDDQEIEKSSDEDESSEDKKSNGDISDGDTNGGAPDRRPDNEPPLTEIGGVTEDVATALRNADITTREQLTEMDLSALAEIDGISNAIAQRIKMQIG